MIRMTKKIVFILPSRDFNDREFQTVIASLQDRGYDFRVVSNEPGVCSGMFGLAVSCASLLTIDPGQIDALIIIGGYGYELLLSDSMVTTIIQKVSDNGKILAAIGRGSLVLAKAAILGGRFVTVFPTKEYIELLKKEGAHYSAEAVEVDSNIITASDETVSAAFAAAIVNALE